MLHLSTGNSDPSLNSEEIKDFVSRMKEEDLKFHTQIFQQAAERGEIDAEDLYKVTDLYLHSLAGITSLCIMHGNKELFPSKKELKGILEKQISLSNLFIKGLKKIKEDKLQQNGH